MIVGFIGNKNGAEALYFWAAQSVTTEPVAEAPAVRQLTSWHPGTLQVLIRLCLLNPKVLPERQRLLVTTLILLRKPNKIVLNSAFTSEADG
jgi:hypothetical protein